MKIVVTLTILLSVLSTNSIFAQIPEDGSYTFDIAFAEWDGKSLGATCTVEIKGDSIKVIHNGTESLSGEKGDVLSEEVGGCTGGPSIIDFGNRRFWTC